VQSHAKPHNAVTAMHSDQGSLLTRHGWGSKWSHLGRSKHLYSVVDVMQSLGWRCTVHSCGNTSTTAQAVAERSTDVLLNVVGHVNNKAYLRKLKLHPIYLQLRFVGIWGDKASLESDTNGTAGHPCLPFSFLLF
jgi:hypothetical protein